MRRAERLFQIVQLIRGRRLSTAGFLAGRLEVVHSGEQFDFSSGEELLACLARVLASAPRAD